MQRCSVYVSVNAILELWLMSSSQQRVWFSSHHQLLELSPCHRKHSYVCRVHGGIFAQAVHINGQACRVLKSGLTNRCHWGETERGVGGGGGRHATHGSDFFICIDNGPVLSETAYKNYSFH